jgi:hypothetical protein
MECIVFDQSDMTSVIELIDTFTTVYDRARVGHLIANVNAVTCAFRLWPPVYVDLESLISYVTPTYTSHWKRVALS